MQNKKYGIFPFNYPTLTGGEGADIYIFPPFRCEFPRPLSIGTDNKPEDLRTITEYS